MVGQDLHHEGAKNLGIVTATMAAEATDFPFSKL
jgi:hypothetical protein